MWRGRPGCLGGHKLGTVVASELVGFESLFVLQQCFRFCGCAYVSMAKAALRNKQWK